MGSGFRVGSPRTGWRSVCFALAAAAILAVVIVPMGSAKPPASAIKLYQVCLKAGDGSQPCTTWDANGGTPSIVAGSHAQLQVTFHDDASSNQMLGSANLTVPTGLGLTIDTSGSSSSTNYATYASTSTSTTLQLRNLNLSPGGYVTVAFYVNASSACGSGTWTIQAKQANDFSGAGNDFSPPTATSGLTSQITGGCHLAWLYQPSSAKQSQTITDTPFAPSGAGVHAVAVQLQDSNGNPVALNTGTAALSVSGTFDACGTGCNPAFTGTTSSTFVNGTATFPSFMSAYTGSGFSATASALGVQTVASSPSFVIQQNGTSCNGQNPCQLSSPLANGGAVQILGNGGNFLFLALNRTQIPPGALSGGCANFIGTGVGFNETDGRNGDGTLDVTLSLSNAGLKRVYGPNYGQPNVPICVGVRRLDANQQPINCTQAGGGPAWADRTLGPDGKFNGSYGLASCDAVSGDPGYGYWWGILGTFQDPNPPFNSTQIPLITSWGSSPDGASRMFTIHFPALWDAGCYG